MTSEDFFRPFWRRAAIVAACAAWAVIELVYGQIGWAMLAGAATLYGIWSFFIAYRVKDEPGEGRKETDAG